MRPSEALQLHRAGIDISTVFDGAVFTQNDGTAIQEGMTTPMLKKRE